MKQHAGSSCKKILAVILMIALTVGCSVAIMPATTVYASKWEWENNIKTLRFDTNLSGEWNDRKEWSIGKVADIYSGNENPESVYTQGYQVYKFTLDSDGTVMLTLEGPCTGYDDPQWKCLHFCITDMNSKWVGEIDESRKAHWVTCSIGAYALTKYHDNNTGWHDEHTGIDAAYYDVKLTKGTYLFWVKTEQYSRDPELYLNQHLEYVADKNYQAVISFQPKAPETAVKLDRSTLDLSVGESAILSATVSNSSQEVYWSSSNSKIATVDDSGNVKGISAGMATITVWAADGTANATCKVTVTGSGQAGDAIQDYKPSINSLKSKKKAIKVTIGASSIGDVNYEIQYRVKGDSSWQTVTSKSESKKLKKLKKNTTYEIRVRAFTKKGTKTYSLWSDTKEATTAK